MTFNALLLKSATPLVNTPDALILIPKYLNSCTISIMSLLCVKQHFFFFLLFFLFFFLFFFCFFFCCCFFVVVVVVLHFSALVEYQYRYFIYIKMVVEHIFETSIKCLCFIRSQ